MNQPSGRSADLWVAAKTRRYRLLTSPDLVAELAAVLRRKFEWPDTRVQTVIRMVVHTAEIVVTHSRFDVITADPDDNCVLECAIDGRADVIASNDHHLLDLKTFRGIAILAGPDLRRILGLK